jgi:hypothetical protein
MTFDVQHYGPFGTVIAIAAALAAVFSLLVLKSFGGIQQWVWLTEETPPFVVTVPTRAVAVVLIAGTFVLISRQNASLFLYAAGGFGLIAFVLVAWFDRYRRIHTYAVPLLSGDGQQAFDPHGRPRSRHLAIGLESNMRPNVRKIFEELREEHPALTIEQFLAGFGVSKTNDPNTAWDKALLADVASTMTLTLMTALLCGIMALYIAASVVEVSQRK